MEDYRLNLWVKNCKLEIYRENIPTKFATIEFNDEGRYPLKMIYTMAECLRDHIFDTEEVWCNFKFSFLYCGDEE